MSDLELLRTLSSQIRPPSYQDLVVVSRTRRRRVALGAVAGAAALILGVGLASVALSSSPRAVRPAQLPSQTGSPSTATPETWTPEQIRAVGLPVQDDGRVKTDSGLGSRVYLACHGAPCPADDPASDGQMAVEVSQGGRSAVFDLHYSRYPWVKAFDEDSVLVQDAVDLQGPVRYRLLRADGTNVRLRLLDQPAPAVPGPGLVVIEDLSAWNVGLAGADAVYRVDAGAGTLQTLGEPADLRYWGPDLDQFLWGAGDDCRVFWATTGTFQSHRLDCAEGSDFTSIDNDSFPPGWLQPGRMAVVEQFDPGNRTAVHVSLDRGATWQRIPFTGQRSLTHALEQLG